MMLYLEGFSSCPPASDTDAYLERRGHTVVGNPTTVAGRLAGLALRLKGEDSWDIDVPDNISYTIGFAFKHPFWHQSGAGETFLRVRNVLGNTHITLQMMGNGEIKIITTEDTVTTSSARLVTNTWCYIEFKCTIDDTVGAYVLRINGKEHFNRTSINTYSAGVKKIEVYRFYWPGTVSFPYYIDDLYIHDDFLGDSRVDGIDPDGNGAVNDWTPFVGNNYEEVDDGVAYDDDTTYVESSDTADQDLFTYDDLGVLGTIHAIQLNVTCRETNVGDFNIEQLVRIGTTIYGETTIAIAGETYETITRVMTVDPSTFAAWTVTNINAGQFGFEVTQ